MNEILLAEDSAADRDDVMLILAQLGVENPVKSFDDGAKAMNYLQSAAESPAILLLDIKLPRMTALEILDRLRSLPPYDAALRIVFSTLEDIGIIKQAYAYGAHTFLSKPVHIGEFQNLIDAFPRHWLFDADPAFSGR